MLKHLVRGTMLLLLACAAILAGSIPAAGIVLPQPIQGLRLMGDQARAYLGARVAIWGDTMVVSAPARDVDGKIDAGAAAVFVREGKEWVFKQAIQAPTPSDSAYFGSSLAIADGILVVGAVMDGTAPTYAGAAYIYRRSGSAWVLEQRLLPDSTGVSGFGCAVDTHNGKVVVGAPGSDGHRGAAFVYQKSGSGTWTSHRIDDPTPADNDNFGTSVAIYADQLAVSAPLELVGGVRSGSVHVFQWMPGLGKYVYQESIFPHRPDPGQRFGDSIALERWNLIVGSPGKAFESASGHGLAYRYCRSEDFIPQWSLVSTLAPAASLGDNAKFGTCVAVSGAAVAVGAPGYSAWHGVVKVFDTRRSPGEETVYPSGALNPPAGTAPGAQFGESLALSGGNFVCGAPGDDGSLDDVGSVTAYTFRYPLLPDYTTTRVWGADRYATCVAASQRGFPYGAPAVVVCTGENWPDALGGAGLAGAAHGPVLLTRKAALPDAVASQVVRLGAVKAYIVGGTGAVYATVEDRLVALLGRGNVTRISGANRYATASAVAAETIRLRGSGYLGLAFVATGATFPDAVAASPLLAWNGTPLVLANPASTHVALPAGVTYAVVAGGPAAVSADQFNDLVSQLGASNVVRVSGADRYATAAAIAQSGVTGGMSKNGVGLATGENFPDALSAGPMLGAFGSPLLLTRAAALSPPADSTLRAWRPAVKHLHVVGGTAAVPESVRTAAERAAWGP